ncbi:MAG: hypothetical protein FRX48_03620 [Lasallia pustulata]|uniref:DUF6594 domain-containing protein n=1 Tax=Lasallia pustulata TaxID=136370 RepID=A0A5M8PSS9_9LECA|nr:MAG: hypothetical protein FRX48_03620 [Lasallia pustulata]
MADEGPVSMQQLPSPDRTTVSNYQDPQTYDQKYEKHEKVHLSVRKNGIRRAVTLAIGETKLCTDGDRTWREYNLVDVNGTPYEGGKYYKESDLKQAGSAASDAMAVDHKVDQWSPLRGNGDAVVPMPQAVDEKQTPLGSPQTVHQESIAEESLLRKISRASIRWRTNGPIDKPICRTLESCPDGYPRLAAFQSSDQNFIIYRGYSYLHSRLLLYLQHEIACAEKELDLMDKDDFEDDTEDGAFYRKCLKSRDKDDVREGRPRRELLYKIKDLLLQYDEVLMKTRELTSFQRPSDRDYRSVRRWLHGNKPLIPDEEEFIHCKEDLITLRSGRECAGFDGFVESLLQKTNCKLIKYVFRSREFGQKTVDKNISYFDQKRVDSLVSTIIMLVIIVLLVLPIVGMFRLSTDNNRADTFTAIGVLIVFTLLFCAVISMLTKARRHEIFAASATYCAVLVVFISNINGYQSNTPPN